MNKLTITRIALRQLGATLAIMGVCIMAQAANTKPTDLRCEYLPNPIGVDERNPRLSWVVGNTTQGWNTSAYRICVATTKRSLESDSPDLWDSGQVPAVSPISVAYAGKTLLPGARCWWKVRVWNKAGKPSDWSSPACWEMGLIDPSAWGASQWIGRKPSTKQAVIDTLGGCTWIWYPETNPDFPKNAPTGTRYFRRSFEVPSTAKITAGRIVFTVDDAYDVRINGKQVTHGGHGEDWRRMKAANVTEMLHPGKNLLAIEGVNDKDPAGLVCRLTVSLEDGTKVTVESDNTWRAFATQVDGWDKPEFDDSQWPTARVIARMGEGPWGEVAGPAPDPEPAPYLRRAFTARASVAHATLYASGLGYAELSVNGHKLGDNVERDPGYTGFDKRALYVTHDVTKLVNKGSNALGAVLGTGWFDVHDLATWNFDRAPWRARPCLRLLLKLEYTDGATDTVVSDASWKVSSGPIVRDGIYTGELYDARRELPGWDTAAFNDAAWEAAQVVAGPKGAISARPCPPVRITRTIKPIAITQPKPGVFVVDMGQNFSGHVRLHVKGAAGDTITMRYSERINKEGMIERGQIDSLMTRTTPEQPFQTDTYICKGGATEVWEQRFSYSGFRYVEVTGFPGAPTVNNFEGRFAHTDLETAGQFECSDEMLNKLQQATLWSYLSNAQSIPTDCPQREKNGWTGDAHLAAEAGLMNFRSATYYTKWLNDFSDVQGEEGRVAIIIPTGGWGYGDCHPAWDSAMPIIAWDMYRYCGDTRILERKYEPIKRYVDFLYAQTKDGIVPFGSLGDWVPWSTETDSRLTSTAFLYHDADLLSRMAKVLGKPQDAAKYGELAEKVKSAYNAAFWDSAKRTYANDSQAALSISLYFGLTTPEIRPIALQALIDNVQRQGHLDFGILGAKYAIRVLTENGRADLAYHLITRKEQPSWAWWITQGATTLWEDWKGESSLNHIMFGDISNWMYQWIAGIGLDESAPGFARVRFQPQMVGGITWAKAYHDSPFGRISSEWHRDGAHLKLSVTVPAGSTATVLMPSRDGAVAGATAPGARVVGHENGVAVLEVGSGAYTFESEM